MANMAQLPALVDAAGDKTGKTATILKPKVTPDWEAVERLFRTGAFSFAQLALMPEAGGVTRQAIQKQAARNGWTKDRMEVVKRTTQRRAADAELAEPGEMSEMEIVEARAARNSSRITGVREATDEALKLLATLRGKAKILLDGITSERPDPDKLEAAGRLVGQIAQATARLNAEAWKAYNLAGQIEKVEPFLPVVPPRGVPGAK